jgi:hypothetical protein
MVVVLRKPVPFTVRVSDDVPATTEVGLIELTVGAAGGGFVSPEFEEEPHPVRANSAKRIEQSANPRLFRMVTIEYTGHS